jgi:hypothetical protein
VTVPFPRVTGTGQGIFFPMGLFWTQFFVLGHAICCEGGDLIGSGPCNVNNHIASDIKDNTYNASVVNMFTNVINNTTDSLVRKQAHHF